MSTRIEGYDIARAAAVFGMVLVNFKVAMGAEEAGAAWLVAMTGLVDGKAAATFVVLAGVGMSLMSRRAVASGNPAELGAVRRRLLKRALFLFVVGMAYTPLWNADILHFYGVYMLLAVWALAWPGAALAGAALAANVLFFAMLVVLDYEAGWNWETLTYEGLFTPRGLVRHLFFNGFHPVFPWITYMLLGIWLGRRDLADPGIRRRIGAVAVGLFLGITAASRWLVHRVGESIDGTRDTTVALFGTVPMPPNVFAIGAGCSAAVVVIVGAIELEHRIRGTAVGRALVATGQLALTLYVAHVVLGMGALLLLGRLEGQTLPFALGAAGVFTVAAVAFAAWWRGRWDRGPLEILMRRATG